MAKRKRMDLDAIAEAEGRAIARLIRIVRQLERLRVRRASLERTLAKRAKAAPASEPLTEDELLPAEKGLGIFDASTAVLGKHICSHCGKVLFGGSDASAEMVAHARACSLAAGDARRSAQPAAAEGVPDVG